MRRFVKKAEITFAFVPGVGRVSDNRVLEGDEFAKYVPSLLVELLDEPKATPSVQTLLSSTPPAFVPLEAKQPLVAATVLTEVAPVAVAAPEPKKEDPKAAVPAVKPVQASKKNQTSRR